MRRIPPLHSASLQRFKQAKAFFRLARQAFDIEVIPAGSVVDYDVLSWGNWAADDAGAAGVEASTGQPSGDSSAPPDPPERVICSSSANFEAYVAAQAGASARTLPAPSRVPPSAAPSAPVVWHAVDSDSDPDEDKAGAFLSGFSCKSAPGRDPSSDAAAADDRATDVSPHKAYVYVLTRKSASQARRGGRKLKAEAAPLAPAARGRHATGSETPEGGVGH